jgi:hypothetical protein
MEMKGDGLTGLAVPGCCVDWQRRLGLGAITLALCTQTAAAFKTKLRPVFKLLSNLAVAVLAKLVTLSVSSTKSKLRSKKVRSLVMTVAAFCDARWDLLKGEVSPTSTKKHQSIRPFLSCRSLTDNYCCFLVQARGTKTLYSCNPSTWTSTRQCQNIRIPIPSLSPTHLLGSDGQPF